MLGRTKSAPIHSAQMGLSYVNTPGKYNILVCSDKGKLISRKKCMRASCDTEIRYIKL